MYKQRFGGNRGGQFDRNRRQGFQGGGRRSFGGGRPVRRMKFFDPSNIIGNSAPQSAETVAYVAKNNFSDFAVDSRLMANISSRGYTIPTPIQDQAIPEGLLGKDVVGIAKTGTGKTASFLIPLINKVLKSRSQRVLIIAPTRELAVQIEDEFRLFARGLGIYSVLCIGGVSMGKQVNGLRRGASFVIGTPGRLIDLEQQRIMNFRDYNNIVLDEVDRILDMGFIENLNYILTHLPQDRQSFFFSATMPPKVDGVARGFLRNPVVISIKSNEPTSNVKQEILRINGKPKVEVLHELLIKNEFSKVLVFGRTKHGVEKLFTELKSRGFKVDAIHGNKSQNQRQRALSNFKDDYVQVLLATDIVARGLDISNVSHVINYDLPESYEDYIHRIGRTGRADKTGVAITFIG